MLITINIKYFPFHYYLPTIGFGSLPHIHLWFSKLVYICWIRQEIVSISICSCFWFEAVTISPNFAVPCNTTRAFELKSSHYTAKMRVQKKPKRNAKTKLHVPICRIVELQKTGMFLLYGESKLSNNTKSPLISSPPADSSGVSNYIGSNYGISINLNSWSCSKIGNTWHGRSWTLEELRSQLLQCHLLGSECLDLLFVAKLFVISLEISCPGLLWEDVDLESDSMCKGLSSYLKSYNPIHIWIYKYRQLQESAGYCEYIQIYVFTTTSSWLLNIVNSFRE